MVWKSNLDENDQEFIEDFGAKDANSNAGKQQPGGVPPAGKRPTTAKKAQFSQMKSGVKSTRKGESPTKSIMQPKNQTSMMGVGAAAADYSYPEPADDHGVGGSGEELAQTLEKVVSQLDIISRTLHVLEQRVSMNEESVGNVMAYFQDLRDQRQNTSMNEGNFGMRQGINTY
mmetsp:Transcript_18185/g.31120  ORF Transcript_18185/g.31120 Transcript_18185/m.31120 type:complete len:173 (+) Transcript_18185:925-1443(+)